MLSLLNQGYYVSPGVMEVKKAKASPHKQELYDSLLKNGKVPRPHHFDCVFKDTGISYPFSNTKVPRTNTASYIIQKGIHEYGKNQGIFAKTANSKDSIPEEKISKEDRSLRQGYEPSMDPYYQARSHKGREAEHQQVMTDKRYNEPMMLNCFQSQAQSEGMEKKKGLISLQQKRTSLDLDFILNQQKIDNEEIQALSSGFRSDSHEPYHNVAVSEAKNEKVNLHQKKLSLDIDFVRNQNQFSPEENWVVNSAAMNLPQATFSKRHGESSGRRVGRTSIIDEINNFQRLNDAAILIQTRFREYMHKRMFRERLNHPDLRSQHSEFNSFGGKKSKRSLEDPQQVSNKEWTIAQIQNSDGEETPAPMNSQKDILDGENDSYPQLEFKLEGVHAGNLYNAAIQKLVALKSLIQKDHPKILNIQERINDVKYYFEFAQNLIADYSRQVPLSLETHDLILTYNETFKSAHKELDSINRELLLELEALDKRNRQDIPTSIESEQNEKNETNVEVEKENPNHIYCLSLVKDLWGNMNEMSQKMLCLQEERRKTELRLQQLERENQSYKTKYAHLKNRANEADSRYESLMKYADKSNFRTSEKDAELDEQLEMEVMKSQKLKQKLLEALEEYEQPSIRHSKSSSLASGFQRGSSKKYLDSEGKSSKADVHNSLAIEPDEIDEFNVQSQRVKQPEKNDDWIYNNEKGDSSENIYANTTMGSRREDSPLKFNHRFPYEDSPLRVGSLKEQESYDQPLSFLDEKPALSPKFGFNLGKDYSSNSQGKSWPSVDEMKKNLFISWKKEEKLQFDSKNIFKKVKPSFPTKYY